MSGTFRKIMFGLLALFVIIQFFGIDKENQPVHPERDFLYLHTPGTELGKTIRASCYDCHSNETTYPWYTNVAPVSWWIKGHIDHARGELNFSEWSNYEKKRAAHKMEEAAEEVGEG